jgi:CRP/FNR family transcriptional regulator, cyclic AMP receptor protein
MPLVELEAVFDRLSGFPIRTFEEGKLVIAEGSSTGRLLFLIQGEVEVSQDGWHIASVAEPGAVFGEMAALRGKPHSADVVAIRRSSFFIVGRAASFLRREPLIALYIAVVQSRRLAAVNRSVIAARRQLARQGQLNGEFTATLDEIGAALHRAA